MTYARSVFLIFLIAFCVSAHAQVDLPVAMNRCGTVERLENKFTRNPTMRSRFEFERARFNALISEQSLEKQPIDQKTTNTFVIPVVFHIVHNNPSIVTDQQILAQLDTLNKAFSGNNGDSSANPYVEIP